ncbi:hypothetical protein R0J90_11765, partial [Micrococcus sp. SIMBA_144]
MGFELMPGTFMKFCDKARRSQTGWDNFYEAWENLIEELRTEKQIMIPLIKAEKDIKFELTQNDTLKFVEGGGGNTTLIPNRIYNLYKGEETEKNKTHSAYRKAVLKYMKENHKLQDYAEASGKKYVFIIDEINRGEISKIFGELFFSLDPGYRGEKGA